jgi:hypothetical protein
MVKKGLRKTHTLHHYEGQDGICLVARIARDVVDVVEGNVGAVRNHRMHIGSKCGDIVLFNISSRV